MTMISERGKDMDYMSAIGYDFCDVKQTNKGYIVVGEMNADEDMKYTHIRYYVKGLKRVETIISFKDEKNEYFKKRKKEIHDMIKEE